MMRDLEVMGTDYYKSVLYKTPEKQDFTYSDKMIPIGKSLDGRVYHLDISEAIRLAIISLSGSGKSFFLRGVMDRLRQIDHSVIYLTDVKGELVSSKKPVQEKFRHLLLKNEEPTALPLVSLRPTFFKRLSTGKYLPRDNIWYSVDMSKMTSREFQTFMNVQNMTSVQKTIIELMSQELEAYYSNNPDGKFSYELIDGLIDNIEELADSSKKAMHLRLRPLKNSNFYEPKYERSIVQGIKDGFVPAINLMDFESFSGKGAAFDFVTTALSVVLREVILGRRHKQINDLWIINDEAARFCGKDKDNAFKDQILEATSVERRFGISILTAWQTLNEVPENILTQCRYVMVSGSEDISTIKELLNTTGIAKNVQSAPGLAVRTKKRCRGRPYAWIIFDRKMQRMDIIEPLAPLSAHMEAGD